MKKLMYLAPAVALAAFSVFAQEESAASQMFGQAETLVNEVKPLLVAFLISAFGIVVAFVSYKLAKRGANKI